MEYPFALSLVFLCLAVTLLAQSAITIFTYNKDKKDRDLNFWWSCLILIVSIIGTIASMFAVFVNRGSAVTAAQIMTGAPVAGTPMMVPPTQAVVGAPVGK